MVGRTPAADQEVALGERRTVTQPARRNGRRARPGRRRTRFTVSVALAASLALASSLALVTSAALAASPVAGASGGPLVSPTSGIAGQSAVGSPATQPRLSVRAAILVSEATGQVLYAANANAELPIASTTKLMTALLTLEHVRRLSRTFTAPSYYLPPIDAQIGLRAGERMSVRDLLLALLIPSADDAAHDLAYNIGGHSIGRFIGMMNARARQLGLSHTHYTTPSGLDTPGNYSTAVDLVKLSVYVLDHFRWFRNAVKLSHAELRTGSHPRYVVSTNTLLGQVPWITGVKTGHTAAAGYVLVGSGFRRGMSLVSAVLGTGSMAARNSNTLALLGWGFGGFRLEHPVVSGTVVARPTVANSPGVRVSVIVAGSVSEMVARTTRLTTRVKVPKELSGPLRWHAVVGSVVVSSGRRVLARIPVEVTRALPAIGALTLIGRFLTRPSTLILLALLIGAASVFARRRWGTPRAAATGQGSSTAAGGFAHVADAVPVPDRERTGTAERAGAADSSAAAERAAAAERERRRAERAARRNAENSASSPAPALLPDRDRA